MAKSDAPLKFDSASTFTGLDFIARSLVQMEANGTPYTLRKSPVI